MTWFTPERCEMIEVLRLFRPKPLGGEVMVTMWASERELARLAINHLTQWGEELQACDDIRLSLVGERINDIVSELCSIHAQAKSHQTAPPVRSGG